MIYNKWHFQECRAFFCANKPIHLHSKINKFLTNIPNTNSLLHIFNVQTVTKMNGFSYIFFFFLLYIYMALLCQIQTKILLWITCASSSSESDSLEVFHGFLQMSQAWPAASSEDFFCTSAREAGWAEEQDTARITQEDFWNFTSSKQKSCDIPNRILWIQPTLCKPSIQTAE